MTLNKLVNCDHLMLNSDRTMLLYDDRTIYIHHKFVECSTRIVYLGSLEFPTITMMFQTDCDRDKVNNIAQIIAPSL